MATLTKRKTEAVKQLIAENNKQQQSLWDNQYWTQKQIKRYFEIKATEIQQQILGNDSDSEHEDLDIEKIWDIIYPSNRGFMWQWWTRICNQTWRLVNSLGIKVISKTYTKNGIDKNENEDKELKPNEMDFNQSIEDIRNEEIIETFIELGKKYGRSVLAKNKDGQLITGNIIQDDGKEYTIRYGEESSMPFTLENNSDTKALTFKWDKDIKTKKIKIDECIIFMGRKNGISDIAWCSPMLPLKIYFRYILECNATHTISKAIQKVKDWEESDKEIRRFRDPSKAVLRQKTDPQTKEILNPIELKGLGENTSKQLMDMIQFIKWFDEDYDNFVGWPSAGAKRQSLAGEFASGSTQWVYEYNNFYKRVKRALLEIREKFGIECEMEHQIQPINTIADLNNGGERNKTQIGKRNNSNAEKQEAKTQEIKE